MPLWFKVLFGIAAVIAVFAFVFRKPKDPQDLHLGG